MYFDILICTNILNKIAITVRRFLPCCSTFCCTACILATSDADRRRSNRVTVTLHTVRTATVLFMHTLGGPSYVDGERVNIDLRAPELNYFYNFIRDGSRTHRRPLPKYIIAPSRSTRSRNKTHNVRVTTYTA